MRLKKTTASKILIFLLIYVFIAGYTSGELALCIGANGHIALEPALHEHCHNQQHIERNNLSSTEHEHDGHLENPHCKPCIDIPIFIGPTDNRLVLKPVMPNPDTLASLVVCALHTLPAVPWRSYLATDENRLLRSVILLV